MWEITQCFAYINPDGVPVLSYKLTESLCKPTAEVLVTATNNNLRALQSEGVMAKQVPFWHQGKKIRNLVLWHPRARRYAGITSYEHALQTTINMAHHTIGVHPSVL